MLLCQTLWGFFTGIEVQQEENEICMRKRIKSEKLKMYGFGATIKKESEAGLYQLTVINGR